MALLRKHSDISQEQTRLLLAMAESLKLPLLQIARQSELAQNSRQSKTLLKNIELVADASLQLLDNYMLSLQLAAQPKVALTPVSVTTILTNVAEELSRQSKLHNCTIDLQVSGRYEPILVHPEALEAALVSLGMVFLEAQVASTKKPASIQLAAHRNNHGGIVAGLFSAAPLNSEVFRRAKELYGRSRHPLNQLLSSNGAGVFVAESLLASMSAHLRVAHHHKQSGLAATLLSSHQLELV